VCIVSQNHLKGEIMKRHRRKHSSEFKARVALEAVRGLKTMSEIAAEYEIHPVMVGNWKKEMLEHLPELFDNKNARKDKDSDREKEQLHGKVGQLIMEVDFLEKKCRQLGIPVKGRNS
jgi:transposase-like protein